MASVIAGIALDAAANARFRAVTAVDAWCSGIQTASTRPSAQLLDLLGRGDGDGHDVMSGLDQRDVQQCRQPAARTDLGARPRRVVRPGATFGNSKLFDVHPPDQFLLRLVGQVEEEDPVETLRAGELRRQLGNVVAGADEEDVAGSVGKPGEKRAEELLASATREAGDLPAQAESEAREMLAKAREAAKAEADDLVERAQSEVNATEIMSKTQEKIRQAEALGLKNFERAVAFVLEQLLATEQ